MKTNRIINAALAVLGILFVLGTLLIGLYKFENRDITVKVYTENGVYADTLTSSEIANNKTQIWEFEASSVVIKKIELYGKIKSIYVKKISAAELPMYLDGSTLGNFTLEPNRLICENESGVTLVMNGEFIKLLQKHSHSFVLERIIMWGAYIVAILVIWMLLIVYKESLTENKFYNHGPIFECKKFIGDLKKYWQYTVYAAKTDLKAEVANSYLNRLWWLLEPFFNMMVYVLVFGKIMGSSVENYATFVFSALLMWSFFQKALIYSVKLVRINRDIVSKVYIPKFVILISEMVLNMLKLLFSLIVLVAMLIVFRVHIGLAIFWVIPAYLLMILCSFGMGMILLHFGVYVDDLSYAVGILISMLMFLSGIFYEVMTTLPDPLNIMMLSLNPVALFVDTMRNALIYNRVANVPLILIWLVMSLLLCAIGVHIVYKNENSYVKVV